MVIQPQRRLAVDSIVTHGLQCVRLYRGGSILDCEWLRVRNGREMLDFGDLSHRPSPQDTLLSQSLTGMLELFLKPAYDVQGQPHVYRGTWKRPGVVTRNRGLRTLCNGECSAHIVL